MLGRLFPAQIDNQYQGHWLAIAIYVPLVGVKLLMGFNVAGLNPWIDNRYIATSVDRIPLDAFGAEAASTVMFMFAAWGLVLFVLCLLGVVVLIRYRAMIPLMYLLLAIEQFGRRAILTMHPIERASEVQGITSAMLINWGLMAAIAIGFALSLTVPGHRVRESAA